jgi:hypothetical protein
MNIEKIVKKLGTSVKEELDALDAAELRGQIVEAERVIRETELEMEADEKLAAFKEKVKDLSSGYKEVKAAQTAKIKYSLHLLAEKGQL